jgi:hypothetical protein
MKKLISILSIACLIATATAQNPQWQAGDQPSVTQLEGHGNGGFNVKLSQQTVNEILANGRADSLIFQQNHSPVGVKIVDPLKVKAVDFTLRFVDTNNGVTKDTRWQLEFVSPFTGLDTIVESETSISVKNEQFLLDYGISLTIYDARFSPLADFINPDNVSSYRMFCSVDYITSSVTFKNPNHPWITGVGDVDATSLNWIRNGMTKSGDWMYNGSSYNEMKQRYSQIRIEDYYYKINMAASTLSNYILNYDGSTARYTVFLDKDKQFSNIGNGWWAPYALASVFDNGPGYGYETRESLFDMDAVFDTDISIRPSYVNYGLLAPQFFGSYSHFMTELYSMDIVLTSDKSLWTHCPVIEISDDPATSIGGAKRHELRKSLSVDKEGKPSGTGYGMGWFPGYAICVETGERLNLMFGENSSLPGQNGVDMIFNPTSTVTDASGNVLGGGHYIYILGHQDLFVKNIYNSSDIFPSAYICPAYQGNGDGNGGEWAKGRLEAIEGMGNMGSMTKAQFYKNVMWTGIPIANSDYIWLEEGNDITVSIRVSRPYQRWSSTTNTGVTNPRNNNMPLYRFSTDPKTITGVRNIQKENQIHIFPNPVQNSLHIQSSSVMEQVSIYDISGSILQTFEVFETLKVLDISHLSNGIYLVKVKTEEGEVIQKIVKQ